MSNISLLFFLFSEKSFNDIDAWLKDLKTNSSPDIKVFLIGNKCDMENARKVDTERAKKFKEDYNLDLFMETSAKLGTNVQQLFIEAARLPDGVPLIVLHTILPFLSIVKVFALFVEVPFPTIIT